MKKKLSKKRLEKILSRYCKHCRGEEHRCRYCRIDPERRIAWEEKQRNYEETYKIRPRPDAEPPSGGQGENDGAQDPGMV